MVPKCEHIQININWIIPMSVAITNKSNLIRGGNSDKWPKLCATDVVFCKLTLLITAIREYT